MPTHQIRELTAALVRMVLGVVFIFASIDKIQNPEGFYQAILNYKLINSSGLIVFIATVLPWVELVSGFSLIVGVYTKGGAVLIFLMMLFFTFVVLTALLRNLDIACGCFTQDPNAQKIGLAKLIENLVLTLLAAYCFFTKSEKYTLQYQIKSSTTSPANPSS